MITELLEENKLLKEDISKNSKKISSLEKDISKNKNEISSLKEQISVLISQNKSLWEEINKLKRDNKVISANISFDCKIFNNSINQINFILGYIREHDQTFSFNNLNLLYRASRNGDRIEICHKLCDDKKNVLIIIKSETEYILGGYCKIGFKINPNRDFKIDNDCFLFSYQLKKIYPAIKNEKVICHIKKDFGLCFFRSLVFEDNFLKNKNSYVNIDKKKLYFSGFSDAFEMIKGKSFFKIQELEVFQLI